MRFGGSMKDDVRTEPGTSTRWIKGFKEGETEVRFLEDRDAWTPYYEHWSPGKQRYYPCTRDRKTCPGCTAENEREQSASKRYLVNAKVGDYVDAYKIPASIITKFDRLYDKDGGSLLKRPFLIIRTGSGTNTEYDVDYEDKSPFDVDKYADDLADHEEMLQAAYVEVWGSLPDEEEEERPRRRRERTEKAQDDNPPSEPQVEKDADAGEDEEILSEEQVRAMSEEELLDLFARCGITPPVTTHDEKGRRALADALIEALT